LGDDRLALDSLLAADPANPAAAGRVTFTHVSLTRWLDFARGLSPGLQIALDNIYDGCLDFYIDTRQLDCPRISATSSDASFSGRGGVADWSKTVIFLDMQSDFVDLGRTIPEAVGVLKKSPDFGHKPLTSMTMADIFPESPASGADASAKAPAAERSGSSGRKPAPDGARAAAAAAKGERPSPAAETKDSGKDSEDTFDLGYDIRLGAKKVHYGYIDLTDSSVIITPGVNSRGQESARLAMKTAMYGGSCSGDAFFSGESETEYEFNIGTKNVNLGRLVKDLTFIPVTKGTGQCQIRVTSRGSEINRFLANLKGSIKTRVSGAALKKDRIFSPFSADIDLALTSGAFRNSALALAGRWGVDYHGEGWEGRADLTGQIWFGGEGDRAGMRFDNMEAALSARNVEAVAPFFKAKDIPLKARGRAHCDTATFVVGLKGGHFELPGLEADGAVSVRDAGRQVLMNASLEKGNLQTARFASLFTGKTPDVPKLVQQLALTGTEVEAGSESVKIVKFNTKIAGSSVGGKATVTRFSSTPHINLDLSCGDVGLDAWIAQGSAKPDSGKKADKGKAQPAQAGAWDFTFMKEFTASGTVRAKSLLVKKVRMRDLTIPLKLENGRMDLTNVSGSVYGGGLAATAAVVFDKGIRYNSRFMIMQFDLGALLRDRKTKGIFKTRTDFRAELHAVMTGPGQMTSRLNGNISFNCGQGSYQPSDEHYNPTGKPVRFSRGSMTGVIRNGVLSTSDFILTGEDLQLVGEGHFDLNRQTMDADFEADMPGLPTIPLRLHGSFDDPKTSIGGMVILNAIGGLVKGTFNLLGGLIGGIVDIFR
ncbi:MAG: AsmA-like C-terminal region-containing protein, partial [Desulfovibrionaceae bacterium]|nr:AsmA-like C-terminal region-containing protein [Desulfovibrionaceae bacterium]